MPTSAQRPKPGFTTLRSDPEMVNCTGLYSLLRPKHGLRRGSLPGTWPGLFSSFRRKRKISTRENGADAARRSGSQSPRGKDAPPLCSVRFGENGRSATKGRIDHKGGIGSPSGSCPQLSTTHHQPVCSVRSAKTGSTHPPVSSHPFSSFRRKRRTGHQRTQRSQRRDGLSFGSGHQLSATHYQPAFPPTLHCSKPLATFAHVETRPHRMR